MTRIIDTPKALLVEVPKGSWGFEIINIDKTPRLVFIVPDGFDGQVTKGFLPPGSYGQPILAAEMKEWDWGQIVETAHIGFKDYEENFAPEFCPDSYFRAEGSGLSLLRSHNLKPETTVVIPKN